MSTHIMWKRMIQKRRSRWGADESIHSYKKRLVCLELQMCFRDDQCLRLETYIIHFYKTAKSQKTRINFAIRVDTHVLAMFSYFYLLDKYPSCAFCAFNIWGILCWTNTYLHPFLSGSQMVVYCSKLEKNHTHPQRIPLTLLRDKETLSRWLGLFAGTPWWWEVWNPYITYVWVPRTQYIWWAMQLCIMECLNWNNVHMFCVFHPCRIIVKNKSIKYIKKELSL